MKTRAIFKRIPRGNMGGFYFFAVEKAVKRLFIKMVLVLNGKI